MLRVLGLVAIGLLFSSSTGAAPPQSSPPVDAPQRFVGYLGATPVPRPSIALANIAGPTKVIDGDTIEATGRHRRRHVIDAPKGRRPCRRDVVVWRKWSMFDAMIKKARKPKSDDQKPGTKLVILTPLTVAETKEVLRRYAPGWGEKQEST